MGTKVSAMTDSGTLDGSEFLRGIRSSTDIKVASTRLGGSYVTYNVTNPDGIVGHNVSVGSTPFAGWWVTGTDPGAGGPFVVIYQNSASPATTDIVGGLSFNGNNTSAASLSYAKIVTRILDATAGSIDGKMELIATVNNSSIIEAVVSNGVSIGSTDSAPGVGNLAATGFVKTLSTVVGSLPSASTSGSGARAFVTDATATTFLSTVAGGGANKVPVVSDGTNWLIG